MSVRDWRGTAKMTVKKLGEIIGTTTDTGGTATAGTLMAKVNALIGTFAAGVTARSIKSVQRGIKTISVGYGEGEVTAKIALSTVDPDKCETNVDGMSGTYNATCVSTYVKSISADSLVIAVNRSSSIALGDVIVGYEVIERY